MKAGIHLVLLVACLGWGAGLARGDDVNDVNNAADPSLVWLEDVFDANQIDPAIWRVVKIPHSSNKGDIGVDGHGHLVVTATSDDFGQPQAQVFAETISRLSNVPWTYYSAINFSATAVNREDLRLGFWFDMTDGSCAYLAFDSKNGMQLKYGNDKQANAGPLLYQNSWYELKFVWDGVELRTWYRERGRSQWLGGSKGEGLALFSSFTAYPERFRIGVPEIKYPTWLGLTMALLVDYWLMQPPG
jgi:hypothetical protein